ncbi:MAG TPA: CAP domain-containing protein [Solirubrobacteraceae bacterium]|nr:CAP domain-containing protein [Solirubrobacteraceae bacterium]
MKRCLLPILAFAAILLCALPAVAGASARRHRVTVKVRHEKISKPAHRHRRAHSKHGHRHSGKRHQHKHRQLRSHGRPATASDACPNANLTPRPQNIESVVAATLCLVNGERARFGEATLIEDPHLTGAASGHSHDMDVHDYFEHVSPDGQTLLMRIRASGFIPNSNVGYTLGENIAWGTLWLGTPRAIVKAWMESPGHRANILDGAYRYTGIGIDPALPQSMSSGQAGGMYTQDFGTIDG